ncbi:sensor histidine kinase [Natrinema salaciae]|uniref:histidine kinase n=1 Tax=Natrinema salaciae TaxID=1186196 RepID=A0A1H9JPE3_9EURY|nr:HAMP domain-containing sensor histidine kinase [Natrinema salaciae]SEQ88658.1 Signal transduction histidine kinase [Natrinema salaciae]
MSLDTSGRLRLRPSVPGLERRHLPRVLSWFGGLSAAVSVGWMIAFTAVLEVPGLLLSIAFVTGPALWLIWGGYRLERSEIDASRYARILQWCFGSTVGFLAVNLVTMVYFPWYNLAGNVVWAHFSVNAGAVGGFTVGYVEAQAIHREVEAAADTVRAEQLEDQRELLTYLNDLLRHEVLNSSQIIGGHASLLRTACDDDRARDRLETIERESDELIAVIENVRAMLDANRGPQTHATVDLTDLLTAEIEDCRTRFDDVEIEAELPDAAPVCGNEGLTWIFSNLLENAVEHNDGAVPHVRVTVDTTPESVTVRVADDGPGIPDADSGTLFERKSNNHGLGLYLSRILANRYGGTVELAETGPDGSVFAVRLPRASAVCPRDADTDRD